MAIAPGTRLGPYEIVAPLGAGGMGEVYRAIDTNLKRATAIKVLPESFASDPDRLARFGREAEVLASLSHLNIAAVYGLERSGATLAMAMELVEGVTLAERLEHGALPADEALAIARQIADGLEAAHDHGVVHRDLKPANIKLRPDGTVKILDFGLAKALAPAAALSPGGSLSPTITSPALTQMGMLLGTAAYMSPEAARGRAVDRRADIWAFGCVLFELLTGRRPFGGEDVSLTLAEVIKSEPDWSAVPPLPAAVMMCLQRCLHKDPRLRLRDIGEMRIALDGAFNLKTFGDAAAPPPPPRRVWRWMLPAAVMAAVAAAVAAAIALWWGRTPEPPLPDVVRFEISAPAGSRIPPNTPALSPDGRTIAYAMVGADKVARLYLRDLRTMQGRVVSGTENAVHPFWSPDGRSLAFVRDRMLWRTDVAGGMPQELSAVSGAWHGSWGSSGQILFTSSGVQRIPAEGGKTTLAVTLDDRNGESAAGFPAFLPDGRRFLVRIEKDGRSQIHLASLDSSDRTMLIDDVRSAPLVTTTPRGDTYVMYLRDDALVADMFDVQAGTVRGAPRVVVGGIGRVANPPIMPTLSVSPAGTIAYQLGGEFTSMVLSWVGRSGEPLGEVPLDVTGQNSVLSPDGRLVAMDVVSGDDRNIWIADVTRGVTSRLTFGGGTDRSPVWSPDGRRIAFSRGKKIFVTNADGSGSETELVALEGFPQSWSSDGRYLLFRTQRQLFVWPFTGGDPIPVGSRAGTSGPSHFSPDGRAIAYTSNESGRDEIYVQLTPPASGRIRVSANGGSEPRWGPKDGGLFFLGADRMMMSADIRIDETLSAGQPRELFVLPSGTVFSNSRFDVDGARGRFFVPRIIGESAPDTPITVVLNWWAELVNRPE
jgi:eukaryotic-like serine/threonine-protein kinase